MNYNESTREVAHSSGRVWRFADYEFDELGRELRVKGRALDLEAKPLEILLQLLLHAGEVVTKEELLESVWPDVMVVDGSLATAVSKLRKAMGDERTPGGGHRPSRWIQAGSSGFLQDRCGRGRPGTRFQIRRMRPRKRAVAAYQVARALGIQRSVDWRESQNPRASSIQVRLRWRAAERPEARDHGFPVPARVFGRTTGICADSRMELRDLAVLPRKRIRGSKPCRVGGRAGRSRAR